MNAILILILLLIFVIWRSASLDQAKKRELAREFVKRFGTFPDKELNDVRRHRLEGFLDRFAKEGEELLDTATWSDLDLDRVYQRLDSCKSGAGEEVLFAQLHRTDCDGETLRRLDRLSSNAKVMEEARVRAQMALADLGFTGKYSVADYLDHLTRGEGSGIALHVIPDLLFIPAVAACFWNLTFGAVFLMILISFQVMVYFRERNKMEGSLMGFSYLLRLYKCQNLLLREQSLFEGAEGFLEEWKASGQALSVLRKGGDYVIFSGRNGAGSLMGGSGIVESLVSLLNLVFHADLILFGLIRNGIRGKSEEIFDLICLVGTLDTAISLASFREALNGNWCRPDFSKNSGEMILKDGYHPLVEDPVPGDITAGNKGILLTGSNASGKSTFLRMVGIQAILAQTLYTCPAKEYHAPAYRIFSSIAIGDNLKNGESYFMAEIRSLKRILDAADTEGKPILCFVDEVLRGTNTLERISAGCQILRSFRERGILCFAATHDLELTDLLSEEYDNYHFEESFDGKDVHFSYRLQPGPGASRNAIRLMAQTGFDESLIRGAKELAENLKLGNLSASKNRRP